MLQWLQADRELRPDEMTDSDSDEDDGEREAADAKGEKRGESESKEEHEARMAKLREQTQREISARRRPAEPSPLPNCPRIWAPF